MTQTPPQVDISEISENSEYAAITNLCAAIGWGASTGTLALLSVLLIEAGADIRAEDVVGGLIFVGAFVAIFTLAGMIAIGLPLTFVLRFVGREHEAIYAASGAIAGFLIIAVLFGGPSSGPEMLWFPLVGAMAGCACAWRWGKWRQRIARIAQDPDKSTEPVRRANPIHDLLH